MTNPKTQTSSDIYMQKEAYPGLNLWEKARRLIAGGSRALLMGLTCVTLACGNVKDPETLRNTYNAAIDGYVLFFDGDYTSIRNDYEKAEAKWEQIKQDKQQSTPEGVAARADYENAKKRLEDVNEREEGYRVTIEGLRKSYNKASGQEFKESIKKELKTKKEEDTKKEDIRVMQHFPKL